MVLNFEKYLMLKDYIISNILVLALSALEMKISGILELPGYEALLGANIYAGVEFFIESCP